MAQAASYRSLGTFEFLVQLDRQRFVFMEANPRLQVEHTVTEAITGLDLVAAQLQIAGGASLAGLRLTQLQIPPPQGGGDAGPRQHGNHGCGRRDLAVCGVC